MSFTVDATMLQMLQSFISSVEQRIVEMENRLNRVEVELKLLELKLDSIPDLQVVVPKVSEFSVKQHYNDSSCDKIPMEDTLKNEVAIVEKLPKLTVSKASPMEQSHNVLIRDDPRYAVYFKMLKMGVPECAVKQKMSNEGIDTALLQTPDAFSNLPEDLAASVDSQEESTSADNDDQKSLSSSDR